MAFWIFVGLIVLAIVACIIYDAVDDYDYATSTILPYALMPLVVGLLVGCILPPITGVNARENLVSEATILPLETGTPDVLVVYSPTSDDPEYTFRYDKDGVISYETLEVSNRVRIEYSTDGSATFQTFDRTTGADGFVPWKVAAGQVYTLTIPEGSLGTAQ